MNIRYQRLMPKGIPRYIRCYKLPEYMIDPYTVVFTGRYGKNKLYISMGPTPYYPDGVCCHGEECYYIDRPSYKHLGKPISFDLLPIECQKVVISDYMDIWQLGVPNFNPGGQEAVYSLGCTCPILDNGHGNPKLREIRGFYYAKDCPVHDK